jgi:hypothetical protein
VYPKKTKKKKGFPSHCGYKSKTKTVEEQHFNPTMMTMNDFARQVKAACVMVYANACMSSIVIFFFLDTFVLGAPVWLLHRLILAFFTRVNGSAPLWISKYYYRWTTMLDGWAAEAGFAFTFILTGNRVYCCDSDGESLDLLMECKHKDSVALANHGSRIDWLISLFGCHCQDRYNSKGKNSHKNKEKTTTRTRAGFIAEASHQVSTEHLLNLNWTWFWLD